MGRAAPVKIPQKTLVRSVGRSVCGYTPMTPRSPFATMQDKGLRSIYIQVERTSGQGRPSQNGRRGKATCMSVAVAMCGRVWGGCGVATLVWSLAGLSAPASAPLKPPGVKPPKTHDYELDVSYMFDTPPERLEVREGLRGTRKRAQRRPTQTRGPANSRAATPHHITHG